ncbi:MAG: autotransporter strand-loop-strand O-heptosyltransferase [bacterium]
MFLSRWFNKNPEFRVDFNDGPCVEITTEAGPHRILMYDADNVVHDATIEGRQWTRAHRKYYTDWKLEVYRYSDNKVFEHRFDLTDKTVRINIDSKSLGDTLAWLQQIQNFAQLHSRSRVMVSQFWHDLFDQAAYPELNFIDPDSTVENCYTTYNIGYYFDHTQRHHPAEPRTQPLGKIASDILGIAYSEKRPVLASSNELATPLERPYVCIATASTAECKHWLYPDGWQTIVDHLRQMNLDVMVIQKEESDLQRVNNQSGEQSIQNRITQLARCEFFVGLGSGLSWLAWAVGKPVVLIAGFSESYTEFESDCYRVFDPNACHGCWNDTQYSFDRGDWNWCPRHKGTERQFECSTSITPERVKAAIQELVSNQR